MKISPKGILILSLIWLLSACGDASDTQYIEKAQEYLRKGEFESATIELKNVLRQNPENTQARFLLGKLYFDTENAAAAEKELRRAHELGLEEESLQPLLARVLLSRGKTDEVLALSLEKLTPKAQAEVLATQGMAKFFTGEVEQAWLLIDQAVERNPASLYAQVAKAKLLAQKGELKQSREKLHAVFNKDPNYALAWSLLGDLEAHAKNLELAEQAYSKAIGQQSSSLSDRLKRAMIRIRLENFDGASADIRRLKKRAPLHPGVNYASAFVSLQKKELKEAQAAFELAYMDKDRYPLALYYMSVTNFLQGNMEQAVTYAENFVSKNPEITHPRKLLALIHLRSGEYAEAEKAIRPVVDSDGEDTVALNLLASALLLQDKSDEGIDLLEKVAELHPDSPVVQMQLGVGLLRAGKKESGVEHIETAIQLNPKLQQADILLILNHLQQKQFEQALKAAEAYRERNPDSAAPYNLIGRVRLAENKEPEAKKAFTKALEIAPGDPSASHALATMALRKKEYDKARDYYHGVLKKHENYLLTLIGLAALDALEGKEESKVKHLLQARDAHPQALRPRLALARHYMAKGEMDKVQELFAGLEEAQSNHPAVLEMIARSQLAASEFTDAKRTLDKLIDLRPKSAQAHYLIAEAYRGTGDQKKMRRELEQAIKYAPEYFAAHMALARVFLSEKKRAAAEKQLKILKEIAGDNLEVQQLEASLAFQRGDKEEGLRISEKIHRESPSTSSMLMLAKQRWGMGDRSGSFELQEQWIAENPDDLSARIALANSYIIDSRVDAGVKQYRRVLEKDKNNILALNNLAWQLRNNNPQEALKYAQRAIEISPNDMEIMDTLAVVLLNNRKVKEAKDIVDKMLLKAPNDPSIRYHSAMIDVEAGNKKTARKTLTALLEEGAEFPEKEEAEKLLVRLQSGGY